jgi:hypothetical protein
MSPISIGALRHPAAEIASRLRGLGRTLRHPLERGEPLAPFFIVGSGRSGTTLLRRIVQASPQVYVPPEMHALGEAIRRYRRNSTLPWPELLQVTLAAFALDPEFERFGIALSGLAARLEALPPRERSLARVIDALYRALGEQSGVPFVHWGDKTPLNAFALEPIRAVFPGARFVHLLRDGVDVAHSYVEAGLVPDLAAGARRWRASVIAVERFAQAHPGCCHELRYEALVRDPGIMVPSLYAFLRLDYEPRFLEAHRDLSALPDAAHHPHLRGAFEPIAARSIGRGRRALGPAARAMLDQTIGADLVRLGYAPAL